MAGQPRKPRIRARRIIERPRLIRALDRSDARVRTLVAPSGYGKTTLAEQWASTDGRVAAWYRARRSAADVSVVARALVAAADAVVPGAGRRLLQRLAVTDDPEREATLLAEMLAEDLADWPAEGWIVIDDYEYLAASVASEAFVETVVSGSPVRLFVAGRAPPSWVAPRDVLAGRTLELAEGALAMTNDEAADVLEGSHDELASGLVALTGGWPAVIGVAAMTQDAGVPEAELPESLYDFFAEELYRSLDPAMRGALAILAEMPLIDRELAAAVLSDERAAIVCDEALRLGLFDERDRYLDFHPLLRSYFERRAGWVSTARERSVLTARLRRITGAEGSSMPRSTSPKESEHLVDVDRLVAESMGELLDGARLPTLQLWVSHASDRVGETPSVLLAQAEIALRQGRHLAAQAIAERASRGRDRSAAYRALMVGGNAAHVGSREDDALKLFGAAEARGS